MTLTELMATLGPVAGVAVFMWLNRAPDKQTKPDPVVQKLDAMIEVAKRQEAAFAEFAKNMAVLLDRSDR